MPLDLPRFCLGGNVFGWTANEAQSLAVLDAARAAGIHFVDTADSYSHWAHDGRFGASEMIIGRWLASRGKRDTLVATKTGGGPQKSIRPAWVREHAEASLARLGVEAIDLYYAHFDDDGDLTESLAAFDALVREGKVRALGLSNFSADRVREAVAICEREGFARPQVLQPQYSLVERGYERELRPVAEELQLDVVPYYALASGFLTGKYRPGEPVDSARAAGAAKYLRRKRGQAVLTALDEVAAAHGVPVAAAALAWLREQPAVTAPLASARTAEQVLPLAASLELELSADELAALAAASA